MKADDTRDRALERLLRRSLEGGSQADLSPDCLDAEVFATWADGGLQGAALEIAEAHVAGCARCQAMAAVLMRTAPAMPVALPWWRRSVRSAWLVPLTAGAAAVAIWSVVPNRPLSPSQPNASVSAPAERGVPKSEVQPEPFADKLMADPSTRSPQDATSLGAGPSTQSARERADFAQGKRRPPSLAEREPSFDETRAADKLKADDRRQTVGGRQMANEKPDQNRQSAAAGANTLGAERAAPSPATPAAPAAAVPASPRSAEEPRFREAAGALMKQEEGFMREIASPDPTIRWRIGAGGLIDRTIDGGKTWTRLSSGVIADLIAGASPSAPICWVVGRDSTVLRSTDGRNWTRVNIPEVADLVGVEALDATTAVVSAADGRKFRTTSGGQAWIKEPRN